MQEVSWNHYEKLNNYYAVNYKVYYRYKIHNTTLNTWHVSCIFLSTVFIFLKLAKILNLSWFIILIPSWIYMFFYFIIIASVLFHYLKFGQERNIKQLLFFDLFINLITAACFTGNLFIICMRLENPVMNSNTMSNYWLFSPTIFYFAIIFAFYIGTKKFVLGALNGMVAVLILIFNILMALRFDNFKISWFLIFLPFLVLQLCILFERIYSYVKIQYYLNLMGSIDLKIESISQKLDISLILTLQVPLVLLYFFLSFLMSNFHSLTLDSNQEFSIGLYLSIFIPTLLAEVCLFFWLLLKPKMIYCFMTNQVDTDDPLMPEEENIGNYRNLIEVLYHIIQERRQRGEIVDSQEIRFLEWLYHNQNQNVNQGLSETQLNELPIHTQIETSEKGYCTICLTDFELSNEIRTLPCVHQFHKECIDLWLSKNKSCPNCNHIIGNEQSVYYTN